MLQEALEAWREVSGEGIITCYGLVLCLEKVLKW